MPPRTGLFALWIALSLTIGCLTAVPGGADRASGPSSAGTATTPAAAITESAGTSGRPAGCDGDERRPPFHVRSGELPARAGGFELAANAGTVDRGERVTFTLTNVAGERRTTSTPKRYALQRRVDGVWQTVTPFRRPGLGFNATAHVHAPGSGFAWTFTASAAGFTRGKYAVCERLPAGEYRFVFAGVDPRVAARFELAS